MAFREWSQNVTAKFSAPFVGVKNAIKRRWRKPHIAGKQYAEEIKAKQHLYGPKKGQPLSTQEFLYRSGYLDARRDGAEIYKYKQRKQGK